MNASGQNFEEDEPDIISLEQDPNSNIHLADVIGMWRKGTNRIKGAIAGNPGEQKIGFHMGNGGFAVEYDGAATLL